MFELLPTPVKLAHLLMGTKLPKGGVVVDATVGNGHDTIFLARLVGPEGKVYGFDIQESALKEARLRLEAEDCIPWVSLIHAGHERMKEMIALPVDGIMFNLGYLPGGNHEIVTKADTTLLALAQGLELLKPGGFVTIVIYPGHAGGSEEAVAVDNFVSELPKSNYNCMKSWFMNRSGRTPYLLAIEKKPAGKN